MSAASGEKGRCSALYCLYRMPSNVNTTPVTKEPTLTLKNPTAADFLTESVGTSLQKLDRFPNQNPVVHDPFLYGLGIHFIIVQNYMAFYQIEEPAQVVHILRFLYGKSNWVSILKTDFSAE